MDKFNKIRIREDGWVCVSDVEQLKQEGYITQRKRLQGYAECLLEALDFSDMGSLTDPVDEATTYIHPLLFLKYTQFITNPELEVWYLTNHIWKGE